VAGDAGVAVPARLEQHPLQSEPLLRLLVGALRDPHPGAVHALGELVANCLELSQVEQPGLGGHGNGLREPAHRKGGHERVGQLALQPRDLSTQRPASGALVALGQALSEPVAARREQNLGGVTHLLGDLLCTHHSGP
jgi:hypothetical protein